MIDFIGDSGSVDVFIMSEEVAACNVSTMPASRSSRTTLSEDADPLVNPVDVAIEMANVIDQGDIDMQNEVLTTCAPISIRGKKLFKAVENWQNTINGVNQSFGSFNEFLYKKNDSRPVVKCKAQGCPWGIYAPRVATTQLICIKKMNPKHTCKGAAVKAVYWSTRGWVGSIIKEKLKASPNYKPKDIAEDIMWEYGIKLNYSQAWRAKEIASEELQGSFKEAYALIPFFCEKIKETNPGSIATFTMKDDSTFHHLLSNSMP